ncbi:MAG: translocation/assembly module TamB domain-containing protein [Bacteroidales bacterium]
MKRLRKFIRVITVFLISTIGLVVLLFFLINLPFSDRFVSKQVNGLFNRLELPLNIQAVRTILPNKVKVEGVTISGPEGDTIICAMDLEARITLHALLKHKVRLKEVYLGGVLVTLTNDSINTGLNISRAFSKKNNLEAEKPKENKSFWEISIQRGELLNISFLMMDPPIGIHISEEIEEVKLTGFHLSLENKSIDFKGIDMKSGHGEIKLSPRLIPPGENRGTPWTYGFKKVQLSDLDFTFNHEVDSFFLNLVLPEGLVRARKTDFANKEIDVDIIKLTGAAATILSGLTAKSSENFEKPPPSAFPWDIIIDETELQNIKVSRGLYSYAETSDTAARSHITLQDLHLVDARLNQKRAGVIVKKLGFGLDNGFTLKQMKGEFASDQESAHLDFSFETENSQSKFKGDAAGSIFEILENPDSIRNAHISFKNTRLSLKDIFFFMNDLKEIPTLTTLSKDPIAIDGAFGLHQSKISFSGFHLSQKDHFSLSLDGYAQHPLQPDKASADLSLEFSVSDSTWLKELTGDLTTENNYSALAPLTVKGNISDSLGYSGIKLLLKSNLGEVGLSGVIDVKNETFDLNTTFNHLMPGIFLNVTSLGALSGSATSSGSGFSLDSLSAGVSILLDSLSFNDYQYINTSITGKLAYEYYEFNLQVDDPGLKTALYTAINRSDSTLILNANATIFAQLDILHLTEDPLSLESTFTAEFNKTPHSLESEISLQNIELISPMEQANIRQLKAVFTSDSSESHLHAEADFFKTEVLIGQSMVEMGSLMEHYRTYLSTFIDTTNTNRDTRISHLPATHITGSISYHEALGMILQDTGIHFGNLDFSLTNRASDQSLNFNVTGDDLKVSSIEIGELKASAIDSAGEMKFHLLASKNRFFENPANNILLNGQYDNWQSSVELSVMDDEGKVIYDVALASDLDSNLFVLNIPKQQILLNSHLWEVENPTLLYVNLEDHKVYPSLKMQTGNSEIQLLSREVDGQHQYVCRFDHVFLESVIRTSLLPGHPASNISGLISYDVNKNTVKNLHTDLQFDQVSWQDLAFDIISINGDIQTDTAGNLAIDMLTRIDSSTISLNYVKNLGESRSLSTDFTSLPLVVFEPFIVKVVSDLNGTLSGHFNLSSSGDGKMEGSLHFKDASMRINTLNSKYSLPDESLQFSGNRLVFNEFKVLDSLQNTLDINGFIDINHDWKVSANLDIKSSGLQVMNTSGDETDSFYGDIFLDSRLFIKGPLSKPVIKGNILLARGSEIFYRYTEDLSLSESAKYVNFVSSSPEDSLPGPFPVPQTKIFESSIETILEIDPSTRINFNLSKWAYDIDLSIRGGGALNFQMLNNNQYSLSGTYLINQGEANLKLVGWPNKLFKIAKGGHVSWDGRIDNPDLKFEASNRVASSYTNPVDGKVRNLDIDVILKLSNHLSDLGVVFNIFTTDQYLMSIINTLSPEEQMRQAITILLFETIDLPGISTSTSYMTQQVNQLVAAQLNSLTKTTLQGIDISFGVNTYVQATTSGGEETKTSLSYDVKKTFADDRAQMRVSGRMNDLNKQPGASDFSLNNISLEYQLDSAASRYLKVYNERSYEDVFEGEVVKTGVGITFRKRYWNIKEIWRRKKKEK